MKYKRIKKWMAMLLITASLVGCVTLYSEKTVSEAASNKVILSNATVGELADYFRKASKDYVPSSKRSKILEGLQESEKATRLDTLVIVSRAFGKLPVPEGNAKRIAAPAPDLSEVPKWAQTELKNLADGGILASSDLISPSNEREGGSAGRSILEELVTRKDAQIMAARFFA